MKWTKENKERLMDACIFMSKLAIALAIPQILIDVADHIIEGVTSVDAFKDE